MLRTREPTQRGGASGVISKRELTNIYQTLRTPLTGENTQVSKEEQARRAAIERKKRMQEMDMEKMRQKTASGTLEKERLELLAKQLQNEIPNSDVGRRILREEQKARLVRELDEQVHMKKASEIAEAAREEQHYNDLVYRMQEEKRKALAREEERARQREKVQMSLQEQLAEREHRKMIELEVKEQEAAMIAAAAARALREAEEAQRKKREDARRAALEVAESNKRFALRDEARKREEMEAELRILEYQRAKVLREEARERKLKEEKELQDRIRGKYLAQQLKKQAVKDREDEYRAKAEQEKYILKQMAEEAARKEKEARMKAEMLEELDRQVHSKQLRELEEKERDMDFLRTVQHADWLRIQKERELQREKQEKVVRASMELRNQLEEKQYTKKFAAYTPMEEAQEARLRQKATELAVTRFRDEVKDRMVSSQLPSHFVSTLSRIK